MPYVYVLPAAGSPSMQFVTNKDKEKQLKQLREILNCDYLEEVEIAPIFLDGIEIPSGLTYWFLVDEEGEAKNLPENPQFPTFAGDILFIALNPLDEMVNISEEHCLQIVTNGKKIWGTLD